MAARPRRNAPGRASTLDTATRQLLKELAQADAPRVIDDARAAARERARRILEDALVDELLNAAAGPFSNPLLPEWGRHAKLLAQGSQCELEPLSRLQGAAFHPQIRGLRRRDAM